MFVFLVFLGTRRGCKVFLVEIRLVLLFYSWGGLFHAFTPRLGGTGWLVLGVVDGGTLLVVLSN